MMQDSSTDLQPQLHEQFDSQPYPAIPIETSPKTEYNQLFIHNLVTPYYLRNQRVVSTEGKVILDAGCGSGYTSLILAEANPGATIVGIDPSKESLKVARERLQFHGFTNVEFHCLSIEDLSQLGITFDYINCDEVLYLLPDIAVGLSHLKAVLAPTGILRTNLHSALQRYPYFRAQEIFRMMGLVESNPGDLEVEVVVETMNALKDGVRLKSLSWPQNGYSSEIATREGVLMNFLLRGDKGYTTLELFDALKAADLEFISMVNWRQWELLDLFQDSDNLPLAWAMSLPDLPVEQQLRLYELIHPIHRLLDFWCGHPQPASSTPPVATWSVTDWQQATVHLHPQLKATAIRDTLCQQVEVYQSFEMSRFISTATHAPIQIPAALAACLLPLWEGPQSVGVLANRFLKLHPHHPVTLQAISLEQAFDEMTKLLTQLETFLYVLVDRSTPSSGSSL